MPKQKSYGKTAQQRTPIDTGFFVEQQSGPILFLACFVLGVLHCCNTFWPNLPRAFVRCVYNCSSFVFFDCEAITSFSAFSFTNLIAYSIQALRLCTSSISVPKMPCLCVTQYRVGISEHSILRQNQPTNHAHISKGYESLSRLHLQVFCDKFVFVT